MTIRETLRTIRDEAHLAQAHVDPSNKASDHLWAIRRAANEALARRAESEPTVRDFITWLESRGVSWQATLNDARHYLAKVAPEPTEITRLRADIKNLEDQFDARLQTEVRARVEELEEAVRLALIEAYREGAGHVGPRHAVPGEGDWWESVEYEAKCNADEALRTRALTTDKEGAS